MKKYIHIIAIATLALLTATACQKEDNFEGPNAGGNLLSFSVNPSTGWNNNAPATKSSYVGEMQLTNEQGQTVNVTISVIDGIESGPDPMSETKGLAIDGSNFATQVTSIGVYGFLEKTLDAYMGAADKSMTGAVALSQDGTHSSTDYPTHWKTATDYYWPKAVNLDFWAWAPKTVIDAAYGSSTGVSITDFSASNSSTTQNLTFTYSLGTDTDATAMPDLMFASNLGANKGNVSAGGTNCVPLDFKHALAAVQFKVNSTKGGKVTDIKLIGVTKSGTCTFNGSAATSPFTWTAGEATATYGHNFDTDLTAGQDSDFYSTTGGHQSATFMMIPQTLGTTRQVSVALATDSSSAPAIYSGTIPNDVISAWEAGKTYVYTIAIDEDVNVNITDTVTSDNVKNNLVVTNTGSVKAYLRAAVIGNWTDGNGKVISTVWTPADGTWKVKKPGSTSATTATAPGGADTGWILGTDGYYYYKYQVPAGAATIGKLFEEFTPKNTPKNSHLELNIAVQAIQANLLIGTDGSFKTGDAAHGWKTADLSKEADALSNFTSGN